MSVLNSSVKGNNTLGELVRSLKPFSLQIDRLGNVAHYFPHSELKP